MGNVRIFADLEGKAALRQVMTTLTYAEFVQTQGEADIIVVDKPSKITVAYREDKQYVLIQMPGSPFVQAERPNVKVFPVTTVVASLVTLIASVGDAAQRNAAVVEEAVVAGMSEEIPGATWILVVDDKPENRLAALTQLGTSFNVVVAEGFDQARKAMQGRRFDFALLDLYMPVATGGALSQDVVFAKLGVEIPYGLLLVLEACQNGARSALVTDLNHHRDPFSAAFDYYSGKPFEVNGQRAILLHASMKDGVKNWQAALDILRQ